MSESVWVVSSGEYSDYSVLCACPSKEDAEQLAGLLRDERDGWSRDAQVESLPMLRGDAKKTRVLRVRLTLWDNGQSEGYYEEVSEEWPWNGYLGVNVTSRARWVRAPVHQNKGGRLEVEGTDHERVRKVYSEWRARLLADPAFRASRERTSAEEENTDVRSAPDEASLGGAK